MIDLDEAVRRMLGQQLVQLMFPASTPRDRRARSEDHGSGQRYIRVARCGRGPGGVRLLHGKKMILVQPETNPDYLNGMIAAEGA